MSTAHQRKTDEATGKTGQEAAAEPEKVLCSSGIAEREGKPLAAWASRLAVPGEVKVLGAASRRERAPECLCRGQTTFSGRS